MLAATERMVFASITFEHFAANTLAPEYRVIVFANGKAIYEGKKNVFKTGTYKLDVTKQALAKINYLAVQFLKNSNPMVKDADNKVERNSARPIVITTLSEGNDAAPRIVKDDLSGNPFWLVMFRNQVEEAIGIPAYTVRGIGFPNDGEEK